jgi:hypothetical protein
MHTVGQHDGIYNWGYRQISWEHPATNISIRSSAVISTSGGYRRNLDQGAACRSMKKLRA